MLARAVALALFTASAFVAGCTSESVDVVAAHAAGHGTTRVYDGSLDELWTAAHAALHWSPAGPAQDRRDQWAIITDPAAFDQVGIWLEPINEHTTRVKVVVVDDPRFPGPFEEGVQKDIGTALASERAGASLEHRP
jgi:hypothetical protein